MPNKGLQTLGLVITDGVGYRNFILSNFLSAAGADFEKIVIFSGLPSSVYDLQSNGKIEVVELPVFTEKFSNWFFRKSKEVGHLRLHRQNFGIGDNWRANKHDSWSNRGIATKFIYGLAERFHSEEIIQTLEGLQQKAVSKRTMAEFEEVLQKATPDILFFTHQRPPYILPLVYAAKKLNIETCSFIFSWDNLSSKGRMAADFGKYLVWSELMEKELLHFYPKVRTSEVEIVGTPQFEPYVMEEYQMSRGDFFSKFSLEHGLRTICYSCGDISTSRNDEFYIQTIATAIEDEKVSEKVNLLVRTSPAEEPERFQHLLKKYPFIKWNFPQWTISRQDHPEAWSQRVPSKEDLSDLKAILQFCDLSINMCSTMSLDFMIFDKPVINPVFGNDSNGLYNDQRFLKYEHYKKVAESGAVKIARNEQELISAINDYLRDPSADKAARKDLLKLQISKPLEGTSKRVASALKKFSTFEQ